MASGRVDIGCRVVCRELESVRGECVRCYVCMGCVRKSAEKFKSLRAGGSLGLCGREGLTLQGPAFLDRDADSGLVNLQGRLLYSARRVHDPHICKEAASRRQRRQIAIIESGPTLSAVV